MLFCQIAKFLSTLELPNILSLTQAKGGETKMPWTVLQVIMDARKLVNVGDYN